MSGSGGQDELAVRHGSGCACVLLAGLCEEGRGRKCAACCEVCVPMHVWLSACSGQLSEFPEGAGGVLRLSHVYRQTGCVCGCACLFASAPVRTAGMQVRVCCLPQLLWLGIFPGVCFEASSGCQTLRGR